MNGDLTGLRPSVWEEHRDDPPIELHPYFLKQMQRASHRLLKLDDPAQVLEFLLTDLPWSLGLEDVELRLHDPEGSLAPLLSFAGRNPDSLRVTSNPLTLQELYGQSPECEIIDFGDTRMFRLLPAASDLTGVVLIPLLDAGRLLGSYHLGLHGDEPVRGAGGLMLFAQLARSISLALARARRAQSANRLTLLDPVTEIGNARGFRRDLAREVAWARRSGEPLTLQFLCVDELHDIEEQYGDAASHFVLKRVSQRIVSDLRATDYLARVGDRRFAVLLPKCLEPHGQDIAERMRADINEFSIDDGRGAVLYVTLSVAMVTWDPKVYPVREDERLTTQLQAEALGVLDTVIRSGGNRVAIGRLTPLMV